MPTEYDGLSYTFAKACREVDRERRKAARGDRKSNRGPNDLIPAPPATVEAVMYELRTHGLAALNAPNCRTRLSSLSKRHMADVLRRLIAIRGKPYCPGSTDDLLLYIEGLAE